MTPQPTKPVSGKAAEPAKSKPRTVTVVSLGRNSDGRFLVLEGECDVAAMKPLGAASDYAPAMRTLLRELMKRSRSDKVKSVGPLLVSDVYAR